VKIPPVGKMAGVVRVEDRPLGYDIVVECRGVDIPKPEDTTVACVVLLAYAASVIEARGYDAVSLLADLRDEDVLGHIEEDGE